MLIFLIFLFNQTLYFFGHDFIVPVRVTIDKIFSFPYRYIPFLLTNLYNINFPTMFDMHPVAFRMNYFVSLILSCSFFWVILLMTKSFFIFSDNQKKDITKWESIILVPFSFLFFVFGDCIISGFSSSGDVIPYWQYVFMNLCDTTVYFEHGFGLLCFFLYMYALYNIVFHNKEYNKKEIIFYSFAAVLLGLWSEFVNMPAFFATILAIILIFVFSRHSFKNISLRILISSFLVSLFFYYVAGNFSSNHFGSIENYDLFGKMGENLLNFRPFLEEYFKTFFIWPKYHWFIFIFLMILILFAALIKKDFKSLKKHIFIILFSALPIIGLLIMCSGAIFLANYREYMPPYFFQNNYLIMMINPILIFVLFVLFGYFYYNFKHKILNYLILFVLLISTVYISYSYIPIYKKIIADRAEKLEYVYNLEKTFVVYSLFGEMAIISDSIYSYPEMYINIFNLPYEEYPAKKFPYLFSETIHNYRLYFLNYFYHDFYGVKIVPEEKYKKELDKRLSFLKDVKDKKNIFSLPDFSTIKNIDKIEIGNDELIELEKKFGPDDLFLKLKANKWYETQHYNEAKAFYEEYLVKNYDDVDYVPKLSDIYIKEGNYKQALKLIEHFLKTNPEDITLLKEMAYLLYLDKQYEKSLSFLDKIESSYYSQFLSMNKMNYNRALVYKAMNNEEKSKYYYDLYGGNNYPKFKDSKDTEFLSVCY